MDRPALVRTNLKYISLTLSYGIVLQLYAVDVSMDGALVQVCVPALLGGQVLDVRQVTINIA